MAIFLGSLGAGTTNVFRGAEEENTFTFCDNIYKTLQQENETTEKKMKLHTKNSFPAYSPTIKRAETNAPTVGQAETDALMSELEVKRENYVLF